MQVKTQEQINHEIILTIIEIAKELLGPFNVNTMLNQVADAKGVLEGSDLLIAFGDKLQVQYGNNGAFATMRQLGREVGKKLMSVHPDDEWNHLMRKGLSTLGFTDNIRIEDKKIIVTDCIYFNILEHRGINPTEHSFCWMGMGFIESFIRVFNKDVHSLN